MNGLAALIRDWGYGPWDLILILVVSAQAVTLAYLYRPDWKAFVYVLPFPFTFAALAVGRPIDAGNVLGLALLLVYTQGVRLLHLRLRVPIVPAIILNVAAYSLIGWAMTGVLTDSVPLFWLACAAILALAGILVPLFPRRAEQGHISPLPIWLKLPLTVLVILVLMRVKSLLGSFTTLFPMVGVFAAYEARHSLWTLGQQIPGFILRMVPMLIAVRLAQDRLGLGAALAVGWGVFLALIALGALWRRHRHHRWESS